MLPTASSNWSKRVAINPTGQSMRPASTLPPRKSCGYATAYDAARKSLTGILENKVCAEQALSSDDSSASDLGLDHRHGRLHNLRAVTVG